MIAHQHQVHEQQVHRRVADALADAERGAVHAGRARLERRDAVDDGEAAVAVAVPVDADARRPTSLITCATNRTTAEAPAGVAWPTVSATQMRAAPARMALA